MHQQPLQRLALICLLISFKIEQDRGFDNSLNVDLGDLSEDTKNQRVSKRSEYSKSNVAAKVDLLMDMKSEVADEARYNKNILNYIRQNPERYKRFMHKSPTIKFKRNDYSRPRRTMDDMKLVKVRKRRTRLLTPNNVVQSINSPESLYPAVVAKPFAMSEMEPMSGQQVRLTNQMQLPPAIGNSASQLENNQQMLSSLVKQQSSQFGVNQSPNSFNNRLTGEVKPALSYDYEIVEQAPPSEHSAIRKNIPEIQNSVVGMPQVGYSQLTGFNSMIDQPKPIATVIRQVAPAAPPNPAPPASTTSPPSTTPAPPSTAISTTTNGTTKDPSCLPEGKIQIQDPNNATVVLSRVLQELEELKTPVRSEDSGGSMSAPGSEGMPCRITGSWVSDLAGVRMDLIANTTGVVKVELNERTPPRRGFLNVNWSMKGEAPMRRGMPFTLTAVNIDTKQIASFCGLCKTCSGQDMVVGAWTIIRGAKDCRDTRLITEQHPDAFRKETLHTMQLEKKLNRHKPTNSTASNFTANGNSSTTIKPGRKRNIDQDWMLP